MCIAPRMRGFFLLAAVLIFTGALAQEALAQRFDLDASRLPIARVDSAWRFHLGDDPGWAQAGLDDSSWPILKPGEDWAKQGYPAKAEFAWFRFHLLAPAHTQSLVLELPDIEKSLQLFSDGVQIAQVGTMPPGPARNVVGADRVFTLPVNSGAGTKEITVAIRLWQDPATAGTRASILDGETYVGTPEVVLNHFETKKAADLVSYGNVYTADLVILIVGIAAALLFSLTHESFYLWFACSLILNACFLPLDLVAAHQAWDFYFYTYFSILVDVLSMATYAVFIVTAVYPRRWKLTIAPVTMAVLAEISLILVLTHQISLKWGDIGYCFSNIAVSLILAWCLIRRWRAGNPYGRLLFFPFVIGALANVFNNLGSVLYDLGIPFGLSIIPRHIVILHEPFEVNLQEIARVISLLGLLAVLVYRFARTSREQQRLSAALKAAHDIQNRLVPIHVPVLGGMSAEIAYHAAEEVGGDFCQILPRPDGSIFVAIGDVSGKGLQAAMLGAVAVGALRSLADEGIKPAAVLERLNQVLLRTEHAGFITCLCLVLTENGEAVIANAGHPPPYLDGSELDLEDGLPLGLVSGVSYAQQTVVLPGHARLTLLSDGVVEARSPDGELFGFERTCEISQLPASEIAARARQFGQEDDITVITLNWRNLSVASAGLI
jgi:sigma-B regulation protein RsbU (phosphoserine phosphatase)